MHKAESQHLRFNDYCVFSPFRLKFHVFRKFRKLLSFYFYLYLLTNQAVPQHTLFKDSHSQTEAKRYGVHAQQMRSLADSSQPLETCASLLRSHARILKPGRNQPAHLKGRIEQRDCWAAPVPAEQLVPGHPALTASSFTAAGI